MPFIIQEIRTYETESLFLKHAVWKEEKKKTISLILTHGLIEKLIIDKIMIKILLSQTKYSLGRMLISASILTAKVTNRQQITSTEMLVLYGV